MSAVWRIPWCKTSSVKRYGTLVSVYPKEAAGLIVNGSYFPCRNIADDPENTFVINPVDYARAMLAERLKPLCIHIHRARQSATTIVKRASKLRFLGMSTLCQTSDG